MSGVDNRHDRFGSEGGKCVITSKVKCGSSQAKTHKRFRENDLNFSDIGGTVMPQRNSASKSAARNVLESELNIVTRETVALRNPFLSWFRARAPDVLLQECVAFDFEQSAEVR